MAYVHQVSFDIQREMLGALDIGSPLQRVLGYLRARLPGSPGFISTQMLYSLGPESMVTVQVHSTWDHYDDMARHRDLNLEVEKIREEFSQGEQFVITCKEYAEVE